MSKNRRYRVVTYAEERALQQIDREASVVRDVLICQEGEAKGHDVLLGADFIADVVQQGNAAKLGVKARFGHPSMCSDALGTQIGRVHNFRLVEKTREDGTVAATAIGDLHLSEESKVPLNGKASYYDWVMTAAEKSPASFGMSIVFLSGGVYKLAKDGRKVYPGGDNDEFRDLEGPVYQVLGQLLGSDFTDSPAATDGVFSAESIPDRFEELLDDNPEIAKFLTDDPKRVGEFIGRFNDYQEHLGKPKIQLPVRVETPEEFEVRVRGLQAAKDKEIATWKSDFARLAAELETSKGSLSAVRQELDKVRKDLTLSSEQLSAEQGARLRLVGAALATGEEYSTFEAALAAIGYEAAVRRYPDLYNSFMEQQKKKGQNNG